ncbi:hypothetical protein [Nocardioides zhouii]|uniref:Uncharacterized protein n=1 Tax=Nocardioides zhouii TaxID=1168729 RepID=A0A4Q2SWH5_9ACTN|nr:hypothetical protein [Nocardioides zhouii]RYC10455.1 hypothetical protein EUA94_13090 [Nocardioides zhouii]
MNVEELVQRTLAEHATDVAADVDPGRASAARREAHAIRVRRGVGAVAAVAAVTTLAGLAGSGFLRADESPGPADTSGRVVDVAGSFAGRTLITSEETLDGRPLEMTVDATVGSQWLVTCAGVGPEYVVHRTIDGTDEDTAVCGPLEVLGDTMSFRWTAGEPDGTGRLLRLWITRDGEVVEPEGAILAAAAYDLPAPIDSVAGADIQQVEPLDGQDWEYVDAVESPPGVRALTHRFDALDEEALLEITSSGSGQGTVELLVDGTLMTDPSAYSLGSTDLGSRLAAGDAHTVTLRIVGDVPDDARLAIVRRVVGSPEG